MYHLIDTESNKLIMTNFVKKYHVKNCHLFDQFIKFPVYGNSHLFLPSDIDSESYFETQTIKRYKWTRITMDINLPIGFFVNLKIDNVFIEDGYVMFNIDYLKDDI